MDQREHNNNMKILFAALALTLLVGCSKPAPVAPGVVKLETPDFHVNPATAADVHGVVLFKGPRAAAKSIDMSEDPACVKAHKGRAMDESMLVGKGGALENAFVYVESGLEGLHFAVPAEPAQIDQTGCWFRPRMVGVQVGQQLRVINSDPVTHNIHPMAQMNREWNHSMGPGDPPILRRFVKSEVMIPVKCNIHSWMHAYIGVLDHPYFAVTKADGSFDLPNLPPGTYTITAWHEKLGTQHTTVTVAASGKVAADFAFPAK